MKFTKLLLVTIALIGSSGLFARDFMITLDENADFMTKKGENAAEEQKMKITSDGGLVPFHLFPFHHQVPTYKGICKAVVSKFNLDAKPEDLEVLYMNPNTGDFEPLKSELTYVTKKDKVRDLKKEKRNEFFNSIQNPETKKVDLFVTRTGMEPMMMEESETEAMME